MGMNRATQCFLLLACVVVCTSENVIGCRCIKVSKSVKIPSIADVKEYRPRPYCSKHEVIVILKDKSTRCLSPGTRFTNAILQTIKRNTVVNAAKLKTSGPKTTTTSAPVTVTELPSPSSSPSSSSSS